MSTTFEIFDGAIGRLEDAYREACNLDVEWIHYDNDCERKRTTRKLGPVLQDVRHVLESPLLAGVAADAVGLGKLDLEPDDWGAGLHILDPGGFLGKHLDYARHPNRDAERRMNLIAFLNPVWRESWGGALLVETEDGTVRIPPAPGRVVAWACSDATFHQVERVTGPCPRVTLATYFLAEPCRPGVTRTRALFVPAR